MEPIDLVNTFTPDSGGYGATNAISQKRFVYVGNEPTSRAVRDRVKAAARADVITELDAQAAYLPSNANITDRQRLYKALNGTETPAPEYVE